MSICSSEVPLDTHIPHAEVARRAVSKHAPLARALGQSFETLCSRAPRGKGVGISKPPLKLRVAQVGVVATVLRTLGLVAALVLGSPAAAAEDPADYAFDQKPGAVLDPAVTLMDADGSSRRLGGFFAGRPIILALGYFHCPSLCSVVRDDLLEVLSRTRLTAGADYDLLVISIDPAETTKDAADVLADNRTRYPLPGADRGWHYLIGAPAAVQSIADAVGFKSRYDQHLKQFLHPAGLVFLTPDGRVSGYVLGAGYRPGDVRTAVTLASAGGIAKAAVPLLLLCFHYDAATGRYTLAVMKVLRLGGILTVLTVGGTLLLAFRRERRNARQAGQEQNAGETRQDGTASSI